MKTNVNIKKASRKRSIKNISQAHGKEEKTQPMTLDQIWGDTGMWKYNTMDIEEYQVELRDLNKTDLQAHATKIGLIPVDSKEMLTKRLIREFKRHVSSYNVSNKTPNATRNDLTGVSDKVRNILSEGR
jgi:hypothetical protein